MGAIHEDFDRATIRLFGLSDRSLLEFLERGLPTHGNGSEEVRNWLVAHGAAGGRGFELIDYLPVPTGIVRCGFARRGGPAENLGRGGRKKGEEARNLKEANT